MSRNNTRPGRRDTAPDSPDLLYGYHTVAAALSNPKRRFLSVKSTLNMADRLKQAFASANLTPEIMRPAELDRLTGPDAVHQGVVLEARPLPQPRLDQIPRKGVVVMLDQVTDPHNVGAIMRSCAAFATTALVTTARHSPQASGTLFKSASGAFEHVPFVKVTNLARAMDELRGYGFSVLGLDSVAETPIDETAPTFPLAVVLGAEGKGLRRLTRDTCDRLVRLDLPGAIKSMNVSNAAALTLYALSRSTKQ